MKPSSNNTLLALLAALALQGILASSPIGGTPRHSRLRSPLSNSSFRQHVSALFGYEDGFEHSQASSMQAVGIGPNKQEAEGERMEALGISLMLLGGVAFQMAVFYLVNFPHPGVAFTTWRVLSTSSSIFISALTYQMIHMHYASNGNHVQVQLTVFLACYVISNLSALLRSPRTSAATCQAVAVISGYVASFAAVSLFLELPNGTFFTGTTLIESTVLAAVVLTALALCINQVRRLRGSQLDKNESEQCDEKQDSILCLCVSFLIVAVMRFYICGHVNIEHQAKLAGITQAHANKLLLCGSVFGVAAALGACTVQRACSRVFSIVLQLVGLACAWSILFAGEWQLQLWGWENQILGGSLLFACFLTVFSFFAMCALSCVAKHTSLGMARQCLNSFELVLGLLIGCSWERSLVLTMQDASVGVHIEKANIDPHASTYLFAALLLAIGVPLWRYLILPRAMQPETPHDLEEESLEKTLKAAAGRAAKFDYGSLKEQRAALGWQFSSPRQFSESDVFIV